VRLEDLADRGDSSDAHSGVPFHWSATRIEHVLELSATKETIPAAGRTALIMLVERQTQPYARMFFELMKSSSGRPIPSSRPRCGDVRRRARYRASASCMWHRDFSERTRSSAGDWAVARATGVASAGFAEHRPSDRVGALGVQPLQPLRTASHNILEASKGIVFG